MRLREAADEQAALAGLGMHAHHRVRRPVLRRDEHLAVLLAASRRRSVRPGVVVVVGVHGPQRVGEVAQRLGQVAVGRRGVGDQGVAAVGRDDDPPQRRGLRRRLHERHVGVPHVRRAALAVDRQDLRLLVDAGDGRVRAGERAERRGEAQLALVVEVLAAEDQGLVLQQRGLDLVEDRLGEVAGQVDAGDLGADPAADAADVEVGGWWSWRVFLSVAAEVSWIAEASSGSANWSAGRGSP